VLGQKGGCNVTYRENVALSCECCIAAAELMDSSVVSIAQLVHTADESSSGCSTSTLAGAVWPGRGPVTGKFRQPYAQICSF